MLQVVNLSKAYGSQVIFDNISFNLVQGERLGLVGRNGAGKSTLFKIILGEESADSGQITFPRGYRCGHLAQHIKFTEKTVLAEACMGLPVDERDEEYRAEIILSGLGFSDEQMREAPEKFSGGFQIRINLAKVLLSEPNLLLLDEPTNYLDIVSVRWLIRFLRQWKNEMIIISHDRDFMDKVTTHSMLIRRQGIRKISGDTEKLYVQVELDEEIYERTRINEDKKRKEIEVFINRFRAQASKAALVQSKVKALERMGVKEELRDEKSLDFEFRYFPFQGKALSEARGISFSYQEDIELIKNFNILIRPKDRIAVIGKNGKGKSTLLRLLAADLKPQEGELVSTSYLRIGYFGQTNINRLSPELSVEQEIMNSNASLSRTGVRNICGTMMFDGEKAEKKISVLSGGEKSRVLLGKIIAEPTNLLLLDEPTNHLDMESIEGLIDSLEEYPGALVIVTHSELILKRLVNRLVVFQEDGPQLFEGDYEYFLKKVGWSDEAGLKPSGAETRKAEKNKAGRKARPRSNDAEVKRIEKVINRLEKKLAEDNETLLRATELCDTKEISELGKAISKTQKEIEEQYVELEKVI